MKFNFYKSISTCFGLGYVSPFPGTLTSFLTVVIIWLIQKYFGTQITVVCILFIIILGYIAIYNNQDKKKDPKEIVIDEFIGQSVVIVSLPLIIYPFEPSYKHYFLGFVFFRLFDIWKPIPINYYEKKYENAFGIIFDDIIAAFYALIAISIIDYLYAYF